VFGTEAPVIAGQVYGDIGQGTARRLTMPVTTHPGDHLSTEAIGDSLDWFASTLEGGTPRPASDQIWYWKEAATGVALIGMVVLMLGTFGLLLQMPLLSGLKAEPVAGRDRRDGPWWGWLSITALLPVLTYFPAFILVTLALPPGPILRQGITNQIVVWALVNTALTLLLGLFQRRAGATARTPLSHWLPAVLLALATVGAGYVALALADQLFTVDFRFWVVAFKLPSADQAQPTVAMAFLRKGGIPRSQGKQLHQLQFRYLKDPLGFELTRLKAAPFEAAVLEAHRPTAIQLGQLGPGGPFQKQALAPAF
jgi:hypothetical protein